MFRRFPVRSLTRSYQCSPTAPTRALSSEVATKTVPEFLAKFAVDPDQLPQKNPAFGSKVAVSQWMTGYGMDRESNSQWVESALTLLAEASVAAESDKSQTADDGPLTGYSSMSHMWFFRHAFEDLSAFELIGMFERLTTDWNTRLGEHADHCLDLYLRSLSRVDDETIQGFMNNYTDELLAGFDVYVEQHKPSPLMANMERAGISSLRPSATHPDQGLLEWPVPGMNLSFFEKSLKDEHPLYGCTRQSLAMTQRLRFAQNSHLDEYERQLPIAASFLSGAVLDSLWSSYFATRDIRYVYRLIDIAGAGVHEFERATAEKGITATVADVVECARDPQGLVKVIPNRNPESLMYISTGIGACWGLVENVPRIAELGQLLDKHDREPTTDERVLRALRVLDLVEEYSSAQESTA